MLRIALFFALLFRVVVLPAQNKSEKLTGLLWEISGNGITKPGYLYGTMHVSEKLVFNLSDSFFTALKYVDMVALETDHDAWQEFTDDLSGDDDDVLSLRNPYAYYSGRNYNQNLYNESFNFESPDNDLLGAMLSSKPMMTNEFLYRSNMYRQEYEEDTYLDLFIFQAGKKLGNRAMLWGAVGGTIPDLDVFANFFTDELTATAFHRGFMHSFLFAVLAPWVLAKLTQWFYGEDIYRRRGFKAVSMTIWLLFYIGAAAGINFIPVLLGEGLSWYILLPTLALGGWFAWKLWFDYWKRDLSLVEASYGTWVSLFFWSIFTHPILDCFTNWGTQVFQPFNDYRVQWNTVSVVDPICTLPFLICLVVASRIARGKRLRVVCLSETAVWRSRFAKW